MQKKTRSENALRELTNLKPEFDDLKKENRTNTANSINFRKQSHCVGPFSSRVSLSSFPAAALVRAFSCPAAGSRVSQFALLPRHWVGPCVLVPSPAAGSVYPPFPPLGWSVLVLLRRVSLPSFPAAGLILSRQPSPSLPAAGLVRSRPIQQQGRGRCDRGDESVYGGEGRTDPAVTDESLPRERGRTGQPGGGGHVQIPRLIGRPCR